MKLTQRTFILGALLLSGLGLPRLSYAIVGCTNAYLTGTYNAQVSSANFMSVLNTLNGAAAPAASVKTDDIGGFGGPTGFWTGVGNGDVPDNSFNGTTTPADGGTTGGTTGSTSGGLGNNPGSLSGKTPGLGRFFLDGNGNVVGLSSANTNTVIGSYNIASDCTGTLKLNTGETFYVVAAGNGAQVLFMQYDASGPGAVGVLDRSVSACADTGSPQSFAFSYFGAQAAAASSSSAATTAAASPAFLPTSAVGAISIDGQGGFMLKEWVFSSGAAKLASATGSYTITGDCNMVLKFSSSSGATTGSAGNAPSALRGLLVSGSMGLIIVQTDSSASDMVPGSFLAQ